MRSDDASRCHSERPGGRGFTNYTGKPAPWDDFMEVDPESGLRIFAGPDETKETSAGWLEHPEEDKA